MTKSQVIHEFFASFGLPAYTTTSVPETVEFPYLTYTPIVGAWEDIASVTCELWYYTTSEAIPNAKAQEISDRIGLGGIVLKCDGGRIWIRRGSPFSQSLRDEVSADIKRRYINIYIEFLTEN